MNTKTLLSNPVHPVKKLVVALLLGAGLMLSHSGADAREISPERARRAVGHWLQQDRRPLGANLGASARAPHTYRDAAGAPLFYVVQLDGGGFVITSADDELEPIIAFADSGEFVADEQHPLWALLQRDLPQRRDAARARKLSHSGGTARFTGGAGQRQRGKLFASEPPAPEEQWAELEAAAPLTGVTSPNDPRVDPLVQTRWNQSSTPPSYNYYTPNNYYTGCVATMGAQVMRYFQWPQAAVTPGTYACFDNGDPVSLTMYGGVYDWSQMPLTTSAITTEAQRQSVGKLLYDVGVAASMKYAPNGSAASVSALTSAFKQRFNYASAAYFYSSSGLGIINEHLDNAVLANLDVGAPVMFSISYYNNNQRNNGHAVVGDGYGYHNGTLYVHLNMGWGGNSDAWYNLPEIGTNYNYNTVDGVVFNIHPTETGELISGRVLNASGTPVSGATVTVSGNGFSRTVTANARGIYAARVPADDVYIVSATSGGGSASLLVAVGRESGVYYYDYNGGGWIIPVSNRWGQDLRLQTGAPFTVSVSGPASASAGGSATFTASVSGGTGPYQYLWYDGATLKATTAEPTAQFVFTAVGERNIRVLVTDNLGRAASASCAVSVLGIALDVALNTSGTLAWTTGGDSGWLGQVGVSHDGVSAAQSGSIGDSQSTWVKTAVSGPGTVSFWWKVSSEYYYDGLRFYIDGEEQARTGGDYDYWVQYEFTVSGAGSHELKWEYAKDDYSRYASGADTGWLDQVAWTAAEITLAVTPSRHAMPATSSTLSISVTANIEWDVTADDPWLSVSRASGSDNGNFTITCAANPDAASRTGTVTVSGGGLTRTVSVTQSGTVSLASALDNSLTWTTGGGGWFGQTTVQHYGGAAAQSGPTADYQTAWIKTTVSGPGTVSFWWKVSSEVGYDKLRFYVDGVEQTQISGEQDWARYEFSVSSAGSHELKWEYAKDGLYADGDDTGWLDQVAWTAAPALALSTSSQSVPAAASSLSVSVTSNVAWTASSGAAWLTVTPASGSNDGTLALSVAANPGAVRTGTVTVSGGGLTRTITVNQSGVSAALTVTPTSHSAAATASALSLSVTANVAWTVSSSAAWLVPSSSSGSNNGTLSVSIAANTSTAARTGTLTISGGGLTRTVSVTQAAAVSPALAAVLNSALSWSSGGDGVWSVQNSTSPGGTGSVQSGGVGDGQSVWLETTVSGTGVISFWWKVSSEENYDLLRFYLDGSERGAISGERDWARCEFTVSGSGSHVLRWVYDKDVSVSQGTDAGWVSQVIWTSGTPTLTVTPASHSAAATASALSLSVTSNTAWTVSSSAAWLVPSASSGNNNGTLSVSVAANTGTAARTGTLSISGGGITRTVAVTQAAAGTQPPPVTETWDLAGLTSKGLKLSAAKTLVVPKGTKLLKGTKAIYTWKRDGVTVASGSGKNFTAKDSGTYTLTLSYTTADGQPHSQTQNFGVVKMFAQPKTATLTMTQTTDTITNSALRGTSVVSGESLKLTVSVGTVGGGAVGPFRYVWYSGSAVVRTQESTSTTDIFTTPAYGDKAVGYKCVVELVAKDAKNKPLATAKSKDLKAKIILPPSAVTLKLSANPVKENGTLTLSATAKGTATLLFTWYKNGQQIATGSAKKFTKKPVTVSDAGTYYVIVSQDKTTRRAQSSTLTVSVQSADGSIAQGNGGVPPPSATPMAAASPADDQRRRDAAATLSDSAGSNNSASATILNLAPLKLSAGDVLTVSGSATREYIILNETQHSAGAYHYEWRDNLTAEFQDAKAAEAQLTLHFITSDGGMYELSISGSVNETGTFELRKK